MKRDLKKKHSCTKFDLRFTPRSYEYEIRISKKRLSRVVKNKLNIIKILDFKNSIAEA